MKSRRLEALEAQSKASLYEDRGLRTHQSGKRSWPASRFPLQQTVGPESIRCFQTPVVTLCY